MTNTFSTSFNISSLFLWNMSPTGAAQKGSYLYLYLPNWHETVVKYDECSSCLKLWEPELMSIRVNYFALVSFGIISFTVGTCVMVTFTLHLILLGWGRALLSIWLCCQYKTVLPTCCIIHAQGMMIFHCCSCSSFPWIASVMCRQHIFMMPGMACYLVTPVTKMCHQNKLFLRKNLYILFVTTVLALHLPFCHLLGLGLEWSNFFSIIVINYHWIRIHTFNMINVALYYLHASASCILFL